MGVPTTNVPGLTFGDNGFVAPTESAILEARQSDLNAAFGGNLNPALNTPQGQIATSDTAIIADNYDQQALLYNSVDPAYASGRMQAAIGRIYFITRNPALPTVVQVTCTGLVNTPIPNGALVQDVNNNLYFCTAGATIPISGSIVLPFSNLSAGPIPCPAGAIGDNSIYQAIPGWDSATNVDDGVLGENVESRAAFEERREQSVAKNARGTISAIQGAVLDVSGVLDAYSYQNDTASPVTVQGVTIAANSIYVCVSGGAEADIANAIWTKKSPGCGYTGNTSTTVYDNNSGYSAPIPSYTVTYQTPTPTPILFAVSLANNALVPADAATQVQNAIINAFAGADGGPRARIGSFIFASRFYSPVAALGPWVEIRSILVGFIGHTAATFTGAISGTALTVSSVSGTIAIGQTVLDAAGLVLPGTTIVSGSGTSWVVSLSQTVTSEAMVTALPNQNSITMQINEVPTINAANIAVTVS